MSDITKGYNGWTNYETWCVYLWLSNDEGSYLHWRQEARWHLRDALDAEAVKQGFLDADMEARYRLGMTIKESFEACHPFRGEHLTKPIEAGVFGDLLDSALSEVEWSEVAQAFIEDF